MIFRRCYTDDPFLFFWEKVKRFCDPFSHFLLLQLLTTFVLLLVFWPAKFCYFFFNKTHYIHHSSDKFEPN
jgi:hypothetical protein